MRSHGVPDFPDPDASGGYSLAAEAKMLPVLLKYVHCMRSHDVPNFPAPGQSKSGPGAPPDVSSPQYLAAASACQHLLPPGDKLSTSTAGSRSSS
jgi:hypothetical protein